MTTTPAAPLVPDVVPPISLEVAILHRAYNHAKRSLADSLETFRVAALDVAHQTEAVARMEAELAAARAVTA